MIVIEKQVFDRICRHAEKTYPDECCGFLAARDPEDLITESIPCTNVQDRLHQEDPAIYPRTAREAFHIDGAELFAVHQLAAEQHYNLVGGYHSHVDADAFFSAEDRRFAVAGCDPVWREGHYLVISVRNGNATETRSFRWDQGENDFTEEIIEVLESLEE